MSSNAHNTEDKRWWVIEWRKEEDQFVQEVCPRIGIDTIINPEKSNNQFAPDLLYEGALADLKCQRTPFFKANVLYRIPPQFAVTFNRKDFLRYSEHYPEITIFFWVDWQQLSMSIGNTIFQVQPMAGIWKVPFAFLADNIRKGRAPLHQYQRRINDQAGNAKDSYLFDVRQFDCLYFKEGEEVAGN